jgi:hypothetical protein
LAGLCAATGCRREVPENELGRVLDHIPELPGMDEPYASKLRYVAPRPETTKMGQPHPPQKQTTEASKSPEPVKESATKK